MRELDTILAAINMSTLDDEGRLRLIKDTFLYNSADLHSMEC